MGEWEIAVLSLSIAAARLACGQQRERLTQVSNDQNPSGFSPQPMTRNHTVSSTDLHACCCFPPTLQKLSDLLINTALSLFVVLSGSFFRSLTWEQRTFCTLTVQGFNDWWRERGQSDFKVNDKWQTLQVELKNKILHNLFFIYLPLKHLFLCKSSSQ